MTGNITDLKLGSLIPTDNVKLEMKKLYEDEGKTHSAYGYLYSASRGHAISNYELLKGKNNKVHLGVIDGYYPPAEWRDTAPIGKGKTYPALSGRQGIDIPKINIMEGTKADVERLDMNKMVIKNTANDIYFTQKTLYIV